MGNLTSYFYNTDNYFKKLETKDQIILELNKKLASLENKLLKCCICNNIFGEDLDCIVLNCGHYLCNQCLDKMDTIFFNQRKSRRINFLKCPFCNTNIKSTNKLYI